MVQFFRRFWAPISLLLGGTILVWFLYGLPTTSCAYSSGIVGNSSNILFKPNELQKSFLNNLGLSVNVPNYLVEITFDPHSISCESVLDNSIPAEAKYVPRMMLSVDNNSPLIPYFRESIGQNSCEGAEGTPNVFCLKLKVPISFEYPGDKLVFFAASSVYWLSDCAAKLDPGAVSTIKMCTRPQVGSYIGSVVWVYIALLVILSSIITLIEHQKNRP
ncbi:MAG: hypothetical protein NTY93_00750 [Candidatus Kaiserbacteria bacterium]|nr:hypothetical protein [Candidatus Kaiserbacteria bacterium]